MPLNHVAFRVDDLAKSRDFYLAALKPLKYKVYLEGDAFVGMANMAPDFWLFKRGEEEPAMTNVHVAFDAKSYAQVDAFHAAALKAGATCNGKPGYRPQYTDGYYAAFVRDPDGNNVEVVFWNPLWMAVLRKMPWVVGAVAVGVGAWWGGYLGF